LENEHRAGRVPMRKIPKLPARHVEPRLLVGWKRAGLRPLGREILQNGAAGKDGTIKHVMSGVNPQGCQVFSFKQPSSEELDHDFLWRYARCLPERGRIGIFNRSYYEDVLVVKVHPELLAAQRLPGETDGKK